MFICSVVLMNDGATQFFRKWGRSRMGSEAIRQIRHNNCHAPVGPIAHKQDLYHDNESMYSARI